MRIRSVNFPERLLEAQENGSIVIFAGAEVSMGTPSNPPNFTKLAEEIGVKTYGHDSGGSPESNTIGFNVDEGKA